MHQQTIEHIMLNGRWKPGKEVSQQRYYHFSEMRWGSIEWQGRKVKVVRKADSCYGLASNEALVYEFGKQYHLPIPVAIADPHDPQAVFLQNIKHTQAPRVSWSDILGFDLLVGNRDRHKRNWLNGWMIDNAGAFLYDGLIYDLKNGMNIWEEINHIYIHNYTWRQIETMWHRWYGEWMRHWPQLISNKKLESEYESGLRRLLKIDEQGKGWR